MYKISFPYNKVSLRWSKLPVWLYGNKFDPNLSFFYNLFYVEKEKPFSLVIQTVSINTVQIMCVSGSLI